jgi:hypothetical protein
MKSADVVGGFGSAAVEGEIVFHALQNLEEAGSLERLCRRFVFHSNSPKVNFCELC